MDKLDVNGIEITIYSKDEMDFISLTDMLKAKDGDFFISDWLRNRNTVEFLGIWERVHNPNFNYGEFATIRSQAGLNNYNMNKNKGSGSCITASKNINKGSVVANLGTTEIRGSRTISSLFPKVASIYK